MAVIGPKWTFDVVRRSDVHCDRHYLDKNISISYYAHIMEKKLYYFS